jgi:hypothetical protein
MSARRYTYLPVSLAVLRQFFATVPKIFLYLLRGAA